MTEEDVIREYINKPVTMKEASIVLGTVPSELCRFIKKHGLKSKQSNWRGAWNAGKTYKEDSRILAKDKHPRFIDGRTYYSDFDELRKKLLPNNCEICGMGANTLHHKDLNKHNDTEDNMQVLCSSCHTTLHNKLRGITSYTFNCGWCGNETTVLHRRKNLPTCCSLKCKSHYQYHIKKNVGINVKNKNTY